MLKTPDKALQWPVSNKPVKKDGPLKKLNAERDLSQLIYNKCVDKDDKLDMSKLDLAKQPLKAAEAPVKTNLIEDILLNKKTTKDDSHRTRVTNRKTTPGEISI